MLPGRHRSATAVYQLVTGVEGGEESVIWASDPLPMCDTGDDSVIRELVGPPIRWATDGPAWLRISDMAAESNLCSEGTNTYLYRLPVYQLRLERAN
jgi:hypothetical protein